MKTSTITELSGIKRVDRPAMAAARGRKKIHQVGDISFFASYDSSIDASQDLGQLQEVVLTDDVSVFLEGVDVDNDVAQVGQDTITD